MSDILTLDQEKRKAKRCARDLGYDKKCISEINEAKNVFEIDRILKKYRKLKYG